MRKTIKTRLIEVLVCESGAGGDSGTWSTMYVDIPADTKKRDIEKCAATAAYKDLSDRDNIAHVAVYNIPELTEVACEICTVIGDSTDGTWHNSKGKFFCESCWGR